MMMRRVMSMMMIMNENHDDDYESMMIGPEVLRKHKTGFQVKRVVRMILVTTTMHVFDDF